MLCVYERNKMMMMMMKVDDVICVADFHDLCLRHVQDFVGNLSRTLSQSRRNGIWAKVARRAYCDVSFTSRLAKNI